VAILGGHIINERCIRFGRWCGGVTKQELKLLEEENEQQGF
jgi:hypothetical protein